MSLSSQLKVASFGAFIGATVALLVHNTASTGERRTNDAGLLAASALNGPSTTVPAVTVPGCEFLFPKSTAPTSNEAAFVAASALR